jgi:hypothetical protein
MRGVVLCVNEIMTTKICQLMVRYESGVDHVDIAVVCDYERL